ncbi:hypothetical protein DsansV1_C19g0157601 [Dioscorea sansibarensis]
MAQIPPHLSSLSCMYDTWGTMAVIFRPRGPSDVYWGPGPRALGALTMAVIFRPRGPSDVYWGPGPRALGALKFPFYPYLFINQRVLLLLRCTHLLYPPLIKSFLLVSIY